MERRAVQDEDRPAIAEFIERHWHSRKIVTRGTAYYPHEERGFIEWRDGRIAGLLTFVVHGDSMELLTLNAVPSGHGIGTAMTLMAVDWARANNLRRIWLITTNDNLRAIGFYQRLGFRMTQIHIGAVDKARMIKPEIPEVGEGGIPIHDEVVLELTLQPVIHAAS
ncbi:MAG: GNAT family N-acetyltransferase [Phycisphaerae bacterium]|nr:GNAT family N-acetyltransferase [Phycisphaerae bacterium]